MSLRNWSKQHTYGLIIGFLTVLFAIPLVILILSYVQNFPFNYLYKEFFISTKHMVKDISFACLFNLPWFHYFLKKEKWRHAYGLIAATFVFLFIIVIYKFIL